LKYTNTIIGRYTNRVPVQEHLVESSRSSDIKTKFTPVSNESPSVSLHGGIDGFDEKFWEPIPFPPIPGDIQLFSEKELETLASEIATVALFKIISEDGDQGFPGRLRVEVLVGLTQPTVIQGATKGEWNLGSIVLVYRAKLIDNNQMTVTPINLTQVGIFSVVILGEGFLLNTLPSTGDSIWMPRWSRVLHLSRIIS
jgi:aldose 1-epimerase